MSERPRVLLVEDNDDDAALIRACLEAEGSGYEVVIAGTLAEAFERCSQEDFAAVLLDLMLPDSAPLETFARMQLVVTDTPIIVITGTENEAVGLKAVQAGAEDYILKGQMHGTLLQRAVQYAIENHRARSRIAFQAQLLEQVGQAVVATDISGRVLYWNSAAERLFGWTAREAFMRRFIDLTTVEPAALVQEGMAALREGRPWSAELDVRCRDGTMKLISVMQTPLFDVSGAVTGQIAISSDVTAERAAERTLRHNEQRLRMLVEQIPTALWTTDRDLVFTSITGALLGRLELSADTIVGVPLSSMVTEESVASVDAARAAVEGRSTSFATPYRGLVLDVTIQPLRDETGEIIGTIGLALDVTERSRSEEAAARYFEMLRAIVDTAPVAIIAVDEEGRTALWNHEAELMFGWAASEVLGGGLPHIPESDRREHERTAAGHRRGVRLARHAARRQTRDGRVLDVQLSTAPLYDDANRYRGTMSIIEDVTAQRRAEQQQRRLTAIIESSPDLVATFDAELRALYINRAGRRLLGIPADASLSEVSLQTVCTPASAEMITREALPRVLREAQWTGEAELLNAASGSFPVWATLVTHRAADDALEFISLVAHDISQSRLLEEQLRQAQKMDAVGRLAGGVAHDFNNLLTAIAGHTEMLREQLDDNVALREDLEEVMTAVDRASTLTRQLLAFSRRQVLQPKLLDLNQIVTEMGRLMRRLIGEDIGVVTTLATSLPRVRADRGQIEQVIMNLVVNARDALPAGGGTIELHTHHLDVTQGSAEEVRGIREGSYAELRVVDNGIGMDAAVLSRIFEPFFTTKEQGKGTGLGLPTVYGIVTQSDGFVLVETEPGEGTAFRILLPAAGVEDVETAAPAAARPAGGGSETILLVEDEAAVRRLGRRILERRGYTVLEAESGEVATRIFEDEAPRITLLVSDVVMPGISGGELARRLREMKPSLRILFTSGYTADAIARRGVLEDDVAFLEKPFTPESLAAKVRAVLDDRDN